MTRYNSTLYGDTGAVDLVIVFGDTHTNSTRGLRPPRFRSRAGEWYHAPVAIERELWQPWCQHWKDVEAERDRLAAAGCTVRVIAVHLGDGPDRNTHDEEGYELLVPDRNDIIDLCERMLAPALVSGLVYLWTFCRGTPAHDGGSSELTEMLAERVSHQGNVWKDGALYSHHCPRFDIQGVDAFFSHYPVSRSTLYHTRRQAAARTAQYYWNAFAMPVITRNQTTYERRKPWDVGFFGHCHYDADSGQDAANPLRVYYAPSWQLPGSYVHRLGKGEVPNEVGARWLWCHDGAYQCHPWLHTPSVQEAVRI